MDIFDDPTDMKKVKKLLGKTLRTEYQKYAKPTKRKPHDIKKSLCSFSKRLPNYLVDEYKKALEEKIYKPNKTSISNIKNKRFIKSIFMPALHIALLSNLPKKSNLIPSTKDELIKLIIIFEATFKRDDNYSVSKIPTYLGHKRIVKPSDEDWKKILAYYSHSSIEISNIIDAISERVKK